MTIRATRSRSESSVPTTTSSVTYYRAGALQNLVLDREVMPATTKVIAKVIDFGPAGFADRRDGLDQLRSLAAEWQSRDPSAKQRIAAARQELAPILAEIIPNSLRDIRLAKGLSQTEVAVRLGVSQPFVARLERGLDNPKLSTLRKLCTVYEIDLNALDRMISEQERKVAE